LRIFCCIFRLKFRWRIWVSASSRSCDIVIVILLCVADHSTRGFWFFSCLQLRIWNLGIDQYGCCMSFGNNSSQEWFCSLDNYNISSEYIALSSADQKKSMGRGQILVVGSSARTRIRIFDPPLIIKAAQSPKSISNS
jgi:hypothetical protein